MVKEPIREAFEIAEFDLDNVYGFMDSKQVADFLCISCSSFCEFASFLRRPHASPLRMFEILAAAARVSKRWRGKVAHCFYRMPAYLWLRVKGEVWRVPKPL